MGPLEELDGPGVVLGDAVFAQEEQPGGAVGAAHLVRVLEPQLVALHRPLAVLLPHLPQLIGVPHIEPAGELALLGGGEIQVDDPLGQVLLLFEQGRVPLLPVGVALLRPQPGEGPGFGLVRLKGAVVPVVVQVVQVPAGKAHAPLEGLLKPGDAFQLALPQPLAEGLLAGEVLRAFALDADDIQPEIGVADHVHGEEAARFRLLQDGVPCVLEGGVVGLHGLLHLRGEHAAPHGPQHPHGAALHDALAD